MAVQPRAATTGNCKCGNKTHDKSWKAKAGLGLNAMAVTAAVCPRRTETGNPSGKRHCRS